MGTSSPRAGGASGRRLPGHGVLSTATHLRAGVAACLTCTTLTLGLPLTARAQEIAQGAQTAAGPPARTVHGPTESGRRRGWSALRPIVPDLRPRLGLGALTMSYIFSPGSPGPRRGGKLPKSAEDIIVIAAVLGVLATVGVIALVATNQRLQ